MSKRNRPRQYEDEPESPDLSVGSYNSFSTIPKADRPKKTPQIGFIRQKRRKKKNARTT